MTPLDRAASSARESPEAAAQLYELFATSDLFVPAPVESVQGMDSGYTQGAERLQFVVLDNDGQGVVPVFDGAQRLADWAKREIGVIGMRGHELIELLDQELTLVLNPDGGHLYLFEREELDFMKSVIQGSLSDVDTRKPGSVEIASVGELSAELDAALKSALRGYQEVVRAFVVFARHEGDDNHVLVLLIELDPNAESHFEGIAKGIGTNALEPMRGYPLDIQLYKAGGLYGEAIESLSIAPLYQR